MTRNQCWKIIDQVTYNCSKKEIGQLSQYLYIYKSQCCTEHWQVNKYIERKNMWDDFSELRSVNKHENGYSAKGILPKFFSIICEALNIEGDGGSRLLSADSY